MSITQLIIVFFEVCLFPKICQMAELQKLEDNSHLPSFKKAYEESGKHNSAVLSIVPEVVELLGIPIAHAVSPNPLGSVFESLGEQAGRLVYQGVFPFRENSRQADRQEFKQELRQPPLQQPEFNLFNQLKGFISFFPTVLVSPSPPTTVVKKMDEQQADPPSMSLSESDKLELLNSYLSVGFVETPLVGENSGDWTFEIDQGNHAHRPSYTQYG